MIGGFIGNPIGGRLAVEADNLQTVTATATVASSLTTSNIRAQILSMGVYLSASLGAMSVGKNVIAAVDLSVSVARAVAFAVNMELAITAATAKNAGKLLVGVGIDLAANITSGLAVLVTTGITAAATITRGIGKRVTALLDVLALITHKLRPDRIKAAISAGFARSTISRH